jgi:DNA-binding NarL/FixJ family response regulator
MASNHLVTIAHEDPIFAEGLKFVLSKQPDITLSEDPSEFSLNTAPDLVVADFQSGMEWLRIASNGRRATDKPRVLIVSTRVGEIDVRCALVAGAVGYLDHACGVSELRSAAVAAVRGERYLAPSVAQKLALSLNYATLTARESDVLGLIACGLCNKRIAAKLAIESCTVKSHVSAILDKLGASSRTEAVLLARNRGLISGSGAGLN